MHLLLLHFIVLLSLVPNTQTLFILQPPLSMQPSLMAPALSGLLHFPWIWVLCEYVFYLSGLLLHPHCLEPSILCLRKRNGGEREWRRREGRKEGKEEEYCPPRLKPCDVLVFVLTYCLFIALVFLIERCQRREKNYSTKWSKVASWHMQDLPNMDQFN